MTKRVVELKKFDPKAITELHREQFGMAVKKALDLPRVDAGVGAEIQAMKDALDIAAWLLGVEVREDW